MRWRWCNGVKNKLLVSLWMQFNAQRQHYLQYFPKAEYNLICLEDHQPIGRIIIDAREMKILLMDIALLPVYRNTGIGTRLVREIQDEALSKGLPVRCMLKRSTGQCSYTNGWASPEPARMVSI